MITIESNPSYSTYWKNLWEFRELIYFLAWRDVLVRYKQTVFGVLWAVLRPLLVMVALTVVFGKIAHLGLTETIPYPLIVLSAVLPWQYFSTTVAGCSESLVTNVQLITKIYFPRMIIPLSVSIVSLVDFLVSLALLFLAMLVYGMIPTFRLLALPVFILQALALSFAVGLWISALTVKYRDFRFVIPFVLQFALYVTPVGFATNVIPEQWRMWFALNPMVGIIEGFRWAILGGQMEIYWPSIAISAAVTTFILFRGIRYFRKLETTFADII